MVGWLKFNIIEKISFMVYLEIQCITFKTEKSFITYPWIQLSVVGLEEYSAHDCSPDLNLTPLAAFFLAWVGPVVMSNVNAAEKRENACTVTWNSSQTLVNHTSAGISHEFQ